MLLTINFPHSEVLLCRTTRQIQAHYQSTYLPIGKWNTDVSFRCSFVDKGVFEAECYFCDEPILDFLLIWAVCAVCPRLGEVRNEGSRLCNTSIYKGHFLPLLYYIWYADESLV